MMTGYIIKLLVLLPVMAGLIFAALWLYRKYQPAADVGLDSGHDEGAAKAQHKNS